LLAPAATGSMTVIGNMTGHPCLTIRVGFTELRTREMPAFLNVEIKEMDGPAHFVPHAITIVAPLFDAPLAARWRPRWASHTGGQSQPDNSPAGVCPRGRFDVAPRMSNRHFTAPCRLASALDGFVTPTIVRFEVIFNFIPCRPGHLLHVKAEHHRRFLNVLPSQLVRGPPR